MKLLIILYIFVFLSSCTNKENVKKYSNGNIKIISHKKDGKLDGIYKRYYENGKLELQGKFSKGLKEGKFKQYDTTGRITMVSFYENDSLTKEVIYYDNDDVVHQKKYYENGNLKKTISYYKNGNKKFIKRYNSRGDVVYEKKFNKAGNPLTGSEHVNVLFIPNKDTLLAGKSYKFAIKLINPKFNKMLVIDTTNNINFNKNIKVKELLFDSTNNLPQINDTVSFVKLRLNNTGKFKLDGVVFDIDNTKSEWNIASFPLKKEFYVKNPTK